MKTNRDVTLLELGSDEYIVMAADNSGAIGNLPLDTVHVPYSIVAAFGARVCVMEVMAAGAVPFSFLIHSFNGEEAWTELVRGVEKTFAELDLKSVEITGSTESNMKMLQSASSFTMIGKANQAALRLNCTPPHAKYAVIGVPLVGEEVVSRQNEVLPLTLFSTLLKTEGIYEVLPVGSKGISHELEILTSSSRRLTCSLPMDKSAGPSTCALISYEPEYSASIQKLCGRHFYELTEAGL
ncbi:ATPase [Fictibacillus sp. KU28468]|uniref:ATPase n=1 Tax=Fictibacillus sp. KU28468 TaxID=2991053 RepID=UPI00223CFD77|nr:ATPase [Fictibacillus sp. KU28468]UZJ79825.1 ATPase [Fictibacillus sp. KU28468]